MYVVYRRPRDYPRHFVVRRWLCDLEARPDPEPTAVTHTLDQARAAIPTGLVRLERQPADDPAILEVWI